MSKNASSSADMGLSLRNIGMWSFCAVPHFFLSKIGDYFHDGVVTIVNTERKAVMFRRVEDFLENWQQLPRLSQETREEMAGLLADVQTAADRYRVAKVELLASKRASKLFLTPFSVSKKDIYKDQRAFNLTVSLIAAAHGWAATAAKSLTEGYKLINPSDLKDTAELQRLKRSDPTLYIPSEEEELANFVQKREVERTIAALNKTARDIGHYSGKKYIPLPLG